MIFTKLHFNNRLLSYALYSVVICAAMFCALILAPNVSAQDSPQTGALAITAPEGISLSAIKAAREIIESRTDLTETQKTSIITAYDTAEAALTNAQNNLDETKRLTGIIVNGPQRYEDLREEITALQNLPAMDPESDSDSMTAELLIESQQSLIAKEAELRATRAQLSDLRSELETLQSRRSIAPREQIESLAKIKELTEQITTRGDTQQGPVDIAQVTALKARLYYRRAQAAAVEIEIASFGERQRLLTARIELTQLQVSRMSEEVTTLQNLTGQRQRIEARRMVNMARAKLAQITQADTVSTETNPAPTSPHPLVLSLAERNVALSEQLLTIAEDASQLPRRQASTRSQIDTLEMDFNIAKSLISLGNLSRQSATTLRQLRNENASVAQIEAEIAVLNEDIAVATQNRLLAQNRMRQLAPGEITVKEYAAEWAAENPDAPALSPAAMATLTNLYEDRRTILGDVANAARERLEDLTQLKTTLDTLHVTSKEMTTLLDTNLLWLPSISAIDISWPQKVLRGTFAVFSPTHLSLLTSQLMTSVRNNIMVVILFLLAAGSCLAVRDRFWDDIERRAGMVGRVQSDSYLHTPAVALSCIIIALPLPIMFFLVGVLFELAPSPDPFITDMADTFFYLSIFTAFFLTWRAWDGDLSLFDKHFKLDDGLRRAINRELRWFIPVTAASTALITLTDESKNPNIYEGFSLAAFLVTTLALATISYRIFWKRRKLGDVLFSGQEPRIARRRAFAAFMIGVPLLCALFASLGYYETTSELLYRLFVSGWLLVGTYTLYGITRRTVVISKRRLALAQAIERRDKAVKARQEQKEAEDRGEDVTPPPTVNYEKIDIETVSRQTEKLLNAFMIVLFAVLMWTIWSDLLPALSFFNNVELGHYMVDTVDPETNSTMTIERAITLWNLMQSLVIIGLTLLAARNLPGFLEIFVLNRVGVDAGTRYAIVTILGYIIFGLGLFLSLDKLGLQWSQLKWVITGLSVGIGLGLQKIIANFVSGLIILFERPVRLGDYVTIGEQSGTVTRIQIRATTLVDLDNREIIIPNEELISQRVTNWTLSNSITRLVVNVGIAYGSDTDKAKDVVMEVLRANKLVLETPPPQFIFSGFGDSSLDFEVRAFLKSFEDRVPTRHALHSEINKAFDKAGISIPFPQRDLHVITPNAKITPPKKKASKPKAQPKPKPA